MVNYTADIDCDCDSFESEVRGEEGNGTISTMPSQCTSAGGNDLGSDRGGGSIGISLNPKPGQLSVVTLTGQGKLPKLENIGSSSLLCRVLRASG
mmetsp:Transcript_33862/g.71232  ORF Transcript_33862/g.71232 Transcript_33862/m.71232 type:complete len:95 (-) Transcript_33862:589-873(-)